MATYKEEAQKSCSRCGQTKPLMEFNRNRAKIDGRSYTCKECDRASSRKWWRNNPKKARAAQERYAERHPEKLRARQIATTAVAEGRLEKPETCSRCGTRSEYIHGHHHDYTKPLEVEWLCPLCHAGVHADLAAESADPVRPTGLGEMRLVGTAHGPGRLYRCPCGWEGRSAWGHARKHAESCVKSGASLASQEVER